MTDPSRYRDDPEYRERKLEIQRAYYLRKKAAGADEVRRTRYVNDPAYRERIKAASRKSSKERYHSTDIRQTLLYLARHRAKTKGIKFDLLVSDIVVPERCPVLGMPIARAFGKGPKPHSPTLDRIDPALGYVRGNVRVISFRANALKSDASLEELELVLKDARKIRGLDD